MAGVESPVSSHEYEGTTKSAPAQIEQTPEPAEVEKSQSQSRSSQTSKQPKSLRLAPAPVPAVSPWKSTAAGGSSLAPPVDAALAQAQVQHKKQTGGKGKGQEVPPPPKRTTGKEKWVRYTPPPAPAGSTSNSSRDSPGAQGDRRNAGGKQRSRKQGGGQSGQRSQNGGGQRKSKSNYNSSGIPPPQQHPPQAAGGTSGPPAGSSSQNASKGGSTAGGATNTSNASPTRNASVNAGLPAAPLMPTNALELTLGLLAQQMEYYFSLENLCKDIFLRRQMNSSGLVPLAVLANFNRVRTLSGGDLSLVVEACRWAPGVETLGKKVRPAQNWEQWILPLEDRLESGKDESSGDDDEPKFEVENAKPFVPRHSRA